ncbi:MAG: stage 0 sporulation protein [Ruminococcaceae bacterium]|nr:stage 0 sporulation protein [Oscillospiraceae bacterium]
MREALPSEVEIVGVRFKNNGKVYYFLPEGLKLKQGQSVIVKTARGLEYGTTAIANRVVDKNTLVLPLRSVVRVATKSDEQQHEANVDSEKEAFKICQQKIAEHKLDMKLVDVEYTFDNNKLLFYFTSEGRVDFRELVKDLASIFKTRIELRQIGIRDETKLMGGLGVCGRPFCCKSFLSEFAQVSIKMAKEQNLSLNSTKISGACGKLMCCLRYEHETYEDAIKRTPKVDSRVTTPDGEGIVVETNPLAGLVRVRLDKEADKSPKVYKVSDLKK